MILFYFILLFFSSHFQSLTVWRSRTKLEKYLIITLAVLLVIFAIFFFSSSSQSNSDFFFKNTGKSYILSYIPAIFLPLYFFYIHAGVCLREPCVHAASEILNSIDQKIDPCDDFYGFACNKWIKNNPIPDGKPMWGTFGKLEQRNQLVIKNVLERETESFKSKAERKAKWYYESCLDENEKIEKLGAQPMLNLIQNVGGWNVSNAATIADLSLLPEKRSKKPFNISNWSFEGTLKTLQNRYNMGVLFGWIVGEDDRNSTRHIIQIDQGGLMLPTKEYYLNKTAHGKVLSAYLDYMTRVSVLLGANETDAKDQMQAVIDFETRLAEITASPGNLPSK